MPEMTVSVRDLCRANTMLRKVNGYNTTRKGSASQKRLVLLDVCDEGLVFEACMDGAGHTKQIASVSVTLPWADRSSKGPVPQMAVVTQQAFTAALAGATSKQQAYFQLATDPDAVDAFEFGIGSVRYTLAAKARIAERRGEFVDGMPHLFNDELPLAHTIGVGALKELLPLTMKALSDDSTRPVLTCACLDTTDAVDTGVANMVSTDTYRLAISEIPVVCHDDGKRDGHLLLPNVVLHGLNIALRSADDHEAVSIYRDATMARVIVVDRTGVVWVLTWIDNGEGFVNWPKIVPTPELYRRDVSYVAGDLLTAVRQMKAMGDANVERIVFTPVSNNAVLLETEGVNTGAARCDVRFKPGEQNVGDDAPHAYCATFLIDFLQQLPEDARVMMRSAGPLATAVLTSASMTNTRYLVMPMQLA